MRNLPQTHRSRRDVVAALTVGMLLLLPACALINAAVSDSKCNDDPWAEDCPCDVDPFSEECILSGDCESPLSLPVIPFDMQIDVCGGDDLFTPTCGFGGGPDRVAKFGLDQSATLQLCFFNTPENSTFTLARDCWTPQGDDVCLAAERCTTVDLEPGDYYVIWEGSGGCGLIDFSMHFGTHEVDCLNNTDDDEDGLLDCEDDDCWNDPICGVSREETCDGTDDWPSDLFPAETIDEFACACRTDNGCNDMNTGHEFPHTCHMVPMLDMGYCAPHCGDQNWCWSIGMNCEDGSHCGGGQESDCLDGTDDDNDTLTDCADGGCKSDGRCQRAYGEEVCNGIDDGDSADLPEGLVDESSCACVNDAGCANIDPNIQYVCHPIGNPMGICNPRCDEHDWCPNGCNGSTGKCF